MISQIFSGVKWTAIGSAVVAITAILKVSILARYLEKEDFGIMALISLVIGFMNLFSDMGLTSAILHKQDITKNEYASIYWLNAIISIVLYLLLVLVTPLIADFYHEKALKQLIPLLGLNLLISAIGRMFRTIENKFLLFKAVALIDIFSSVLSLFCATYLAVSGFGIYSLVYSALAHYTFSSIVLLLLGLKKYGLLFHFNSNETKPFLRIGLYQVGGQVVNYFNRDIDLLLVGKLFSTEVLGGYSLAKQLVMRPMNFINPIMTRVGAPVLSKFQEQIHILKDNYLKLINIVSTINILVYVAIVIFAEFFVEILYGRGFDEIVSLVRILCFYMVFRAVGSPVGSLVVATGKTHLEFYWNLLTLLILPLFIYQGSLFGVKGSAWGLTLSAIVLFVPGWKFLVNKMTGASLFEYINAIVLLRIPFKRK